MTVCKTVSYNDLKVVVEASVNKVGGREYDSGTYVEDLLATAATADPDDERGITLDDINADPAFEDYAKQQLINGSEL